MLRKIWRNPQAVIGLGLIVLICAVAILAPLLAPHAPDEMNPLMKYQAPSADYPLGTDQLGRCELSRLLYGARASLGLALPILILLGGIGLILGMMTACIGGWFDRVVTGISQVFIAFPTLIIAVAIIGVLGNGLQNIIWAVVISMWARFMQLIRTYAKTELGRDYIVAARVSGCGMWQLIVHHLIPNILPQFLVYFSTGVASAILTVSSFSFLGLGLPSGTAEWGAMLEEAGAVILLGQSGSGKTMTCRAILGLLNSSAFQVNGEIFFDNRSLLQLKEKERALYYGNKIAFIPQNPMTALDPSRKIGAQMAEFLNLHQDLKKKEALSLYEQALSRAGLTDTKRILSSRPYQLSGGMLQRCLIALAIAGNAKLVVADEPTTALDAIHRDKAVEQFLHLQEQGCALLLVTHDFDVARHVGGHVLILKEGQMVEQGCAQEVLQNPIADYTKELIEAIHLGWG